MKLYSYCLRYDDGAAPNPYWGVCTLVICKPAIRRTAEIGDWVVGLGSANSPIGDISDYVVYAMKVTNKMTLEEYDLYCQSELQSKIPDWRSRNYKKRMGDCIYDYSNGHPPKLRWSVHNEDNRKRDLSGENALLSTHFYYFGDKPVRLPEELHPIIHATQGHKSNLNDAYVEPFSQWLEGLGYKKNSLLGEPQLMEEYSRDTDIQAKCSVRSLEEKDE